MHATERYARYVLNLVRLRVDGGAIGFDWSVERRAKAVWSEHGRGGDRRRPG